MHYNITIGALIRMWALIGIGALINKNSFKRGAYSEGDAKSNHYGTIVLPQSIRLTLQI